MKGHRWYQFWHWFFVYNISMCEYKFVKTLFGTNVQYQKTYCIICKKSFLQYESTASDDASDKGE